MRAVEGLLPAGVIGKSLGLGSEFPEVSKMPRVAPLAEIPAAHPKAEGAKCSPPTGLKHFAFSLFV